jgi:hypothetical protein
MVGFSMYLSTGVSPAYLDVELTQVGAPAKRLEWTPDLRQHASEVAFALLGEMTTVELDRVYGLIRFTAKPIARRAAPTTPPPPRDTWRVVEATDPPPLCPNCGTPAVIDPMELWEHSGTGEQRWRCGRDACQPARTVEGGHEFRARGHAMPMGATVDEIVRARFGLSSVTPEPVTTRYDAALMATVATYAGGRTLILYDTGDLSVSSSDRMDAADIPERDLGAFIKALESLMVARAYWLLGGRRG